MKKYIILALAVAAALILIPSAMCSAVKRQNQTAAKSETVKEKSNSTETADIKDETIAVFLPSENKTEEMDMRDYIIGCLGAEMPALYEHEALCAQALACVTLARYMAENNAVNTLSGGAVISADSKSYQGYMSVDEMKERWQDDFDKYYERLCSAVDEVLNYTITYDGQTALSAFHAISTGVTESSANVWGKNIPYLVSVDSENDKNASGYASSKSFDKEELATLLGNLTVPEDENEWAVNESYTKAGNLRNVEIFGKSFTGDELREKLGLRSAAITVKIEDGTITFDVKGYGHGVGMSQNGANEYAKQGYSWREIIAHYYPGTSVC